MQQPERAFGLGQAVDGILGELLQPGQEVYAHQPSSAALGWLALTLAERASSPVVAVFDGPRNRDQFLQDIEALAGEKADAIGCFPAWESLPQDDRQPRPEIGGERLGLLLACRQNRCPPVVVTSIQALMQKTIDPSGLDTDTFALAVNDHIALDDLTSTLQERGYNFVLQVSAPTEAATRGGILDVWPPTEPWPVRIEFFGTVIDSIRTFDTNNQRSLERKASIALTPASEWGGNNDSLGGSLLDALPATGTWMIVDPDSQVQHAVVLEEMAVEADAGQYVVSAATIRDAIDGRDAWTRLVLRPVLAGASVVSLGLEPLAGLPTLPGDQPDPDRLEAERVRFVQGLFHRHQEGERLRFYFATEGSRDRLLEQYAQISPEWVSLGRLSEGFRVPGLGLTVVAENDLYGQRKLWRGRSGVLPGGRRTRRKGRLISDWTDLQPGDFVVHIDHGIGKYLGLFEITFRGRQQEVLTIAYDGSAKLHLPVNHAHLLSRYAGIGARPPRLHRLGGRKWATDRYGAERAVQDLAASLLETQAEREMKPGYSFAPDTPWQLEFEAAFPFEETPDQTSAIAEVKQDMERPHPMDRLVCGDVGYGKTEVAMRAAFKVVMNGKQVAVLVPTTILAQQHAETFASRMVAFPFSIEMLSRFQSKSRQRTIVEDVKKGAVDIVIGTHRLLQKDIAFHDLGLLIIDEEQRFGVEQKEKIKRLRTQVDVLTLSATPIPRTLYMSLLGAKEMSTIQSPPQERLPIETTIATEDSALVRKAILREINRGGQVYFLHNRVHSIERVYHRLDSLVPEARIAIGHGQMNEHELEAVMHTFVAGDIDVLLCTTIIESGLDIPNVNTIIIDRADQFGLAELYQLRGRVGRFKRQAFAFLLLPRGADLVGPARERIGALSRYAGLGTGFKLALKDLEIRGTGNLLGSEQSGHITAVGFELYCQFLKRTVARLRGEEVPPLVDVDMKLDFITYATADAERADAVVIPLDYIEDEDLRVHAYRKLATLASEEEIDRLVEEFADRFGPIPLSLHRLFLVNRARLLAAARDIDQVETRGDKVMMVRQGDFVKEGSRFPRLTGRVPDEMLQELVDIIRGVPGTH